MKLNPAHAIFDGNMFVQLRSMLEPITPHPSLPMLDMSIGEPQMPPCQLLLDSVAKHNSDWQFYPKATGNARFIGAVQNYINRRWPAASQLADDAQIIPVPGTREPLHLLGHLVAATKPNAVALVTNPFYHAAGWGIGKWCENSVSGQAVLIIIFCLIWSRLMPIFWRVRHCYIYAPNQSAW